MCWFMQPIVTPLQTRIKFLCPAKGRVAYT
jgi:hypothetical protein